MRPGMDSFPLARGYNCGGSAIPVELVERCEALGMKPRRAYGMTECPTVSASVGDDGPEIRLGTDGRILPGVDVRVVDADGADVAPGEVGEFLVRGPQRALGYLDPQHTRDGFDADGWFRSGDLGFVDAEGCITVTGRTKDIINRGGEKLSAQEIEALLRRHPAVADAAVVAAPHPRSRRGTRGLHDPAPGGDGDRRRRPRVPPRRGRGAAEDPAHLRRRRRPAPHRVGQGQEVRAGRAVAAAPDALNLMTRAAGSAATCRLRSTWNSRSVRCQPSGPRS